MRALVWLACVSACGFRAPGNTTQDDAAASATGDGGSSDGPCPDDDGDTICNAVDQCPGMDDRIDIDGDGIPDCKDDWLCGPTKPSAPSQPFVHIEATWQWSADHVHLDGGDNVMNVKAGQPIHLQVDWLIRINCFQTQSCTAQLELGFDVTGRDRCVFDGTVGDNAIKGGTVDDMVTIAPTPTGAFGYYEMRFHIGQRSSCGTSGWDGNAPGSASTFAKLCIVK